MANNEKENVNFSAKSNFYNQTSKTVNQIGSANNNSFDSDEQFILDIIRKSKQESIQNLTELLRLQESKSVLLIRLLERYKDQLDDKF
jgi:hypothetical protein